MQEKKFVSTVSSSNTVCILSSCASDPMISAAAGITSLRMFHVIVSKLWFDLRKRKMFSSRRHIWARPFCTAEPLSSSGGRSCAGNWSDHRLTRRNISNGFFPPSASASDASHVSLFLFDVLKCFKHVWRVFPLWFNGVSRTDRLLFGTCISVEETRQQ